MRTTLDLEELNGYAFCPEFERRRKGDPDAGLSPAEAKYRRTLRKLLVRFYTELADDNLLKESVLRRMWSTMWEIPIAGFQNRSFKKGAAATFNGMLTDDERMILRGVKVINGLAGRQMNKKIAPVIVDEPFSLVLDGITIVGRFDLVFEDEAGHFWIVDWTQEHARFDPKYSFKHTLLAEGFRQQTGRNAGVLVDYLLTLGNLVEGAPRDAGETALQVQEAATIALAIVEDLNFRRIGKWCGSCRYKPDCFGTKHVQSRQTRNRPRKRSLPPTVE